MENQDTAPVERSEAIVFLRLTTKKLPWNGRIHEAENLIGIFRRHENTSAVLRKILHVQPTLVSPEGFVGGIGIKVIRGSRP